MQTQFDGPLFIIGMPRSGTKLLRQLLDNHPKISIPDIETEFLPYLVKIATKSDLGNHNLFHRFYLEIINNSYFYYNKSKGYLTENQWRNACRSFSAADIFEAFVRVETGISPGSGIIWGDKSPSYINHLPMLKAVYPQARFIHIIRDVRDYCRSIARAWGKDIYRAAWRWNISTINARNECYSIPDRYKEINYEELIREPKKVLNDICNFLSIDFYEEMLNLSAPTENLGDTQDTMFIVSSNAGKFHELGNKKIARLEALAFNAMNAFGYEPLNQKTSQAYMHQFEYNARQIFDALNLIRTSKISVLNALIFHSRYFRLTRQ